jgi:hemerythrin-like domain-containing protein
MERTLDRIDPNDRAAALDFADRLREYVEVVRCHIQVEEDVFFDTAQHYLTQQDRKELTEEFEAVHWDEIEEGVASYWEDLDHRLWVAETQPA